MLLNCARNARCVTLTARTANVHWQRLLLSSSATSVQRPTLAEYSASSCPPGFVNVADLLDEVFPSLVVKSAAPPRRLDMTTAIAAMTTKPKKVRTVRSNDLPPSADFLTLVDRLNTYRLPKVDDVGEAIVDAQLNERNAALLAVLRPRILKVLRDEPSVTGCLRILDIIALKNVRDEEIVTAVYDTIVGYDKPLSAGRLSKLAVCYSKLGIPHDDALERIRDDLTYLVRVSSSTADNAAHIAKTVVSLARARMGSVLHWTVYANWTRQHFDVIWPSSYTHTTFSSFTHKLTLLNAFAMMSSPLLSDKWSNVTQVLASEELDPMFVFTNAYSAATALELKVDLAKRVLSLSSMKALLPPANASVISSLSIFIALRLWHIGAYEAFICKRNVERNVSICKYIHGLVKADNNRTELFWRVKYSKDMSSVDAFRQLLHDIAPLGTHSTPPHIHPERGVGVEANVYVHHGQIISVEHAKRISQKGVQPTIVSVLYFMKSHTLTMTSGQGNNDNNAVLRLDGRSNLSVQLMRASQCANTLPATQPVVFTQPDLDALADDESRRKHIRRQIVRLSKRYLDADWPAGLVDGERSAA